MRNVTLRIKRVYLEQILDGSKKSELRSCTEFYERLLREGESIDTLTLHYQTERKVICDVVSVKRVPHPRGQPTEGDILTTPEIFKINLRNPREFFQLKGK